MSKTHEDIMNKLKESPGVKEYLQSEEFKINQLKLERMYSILNQDIVTEDDIKELEDIETSTGISFRAIN